MPRKPPARLLTVAGSDSGGGAGIQADLKTFAAHGAFGMSVIAAITAQNTREVRSVLALPPRLVVDQLDAVWDDIGVDAVKIGMLGTPEIVVAVAAALRRHLRETPVPVVLDPVMIAKSGDALLRDEAIAALVEELLPLVTLVTPNLPELARLTGLEVDPRAGADGEVSRLAAARELAGRGPAVLAKGGHAEGDEIVDLLLADGEVHRVTHPRVRTRSTHGTGCTLSSAIAARLGSGEALPAAARGGIEFLIGALRSAYPLGSGGHGPVDHLYRLFPAEGSA